MKRRTLVFVVAGALMLGSAAPASTQEVSQQRLLVRASPIALIFTNFKVGAEFMVTEQIAADASLNHNRSFFGSELAITSALLGARLYPTAAFKGFSVGGNLGAMRFAFTEEDTETFPLLHVELAYSWLLGDSQRFYVTPAFGAARLFASGTIDGETVEGEESFDWSASIPIPTWRLQVGYRF